MAVRTKHRRASAPPKGVSELIVENDLRSVDGLEPGERRLATRNRYSPVVLAMTLLATIGVIAYGIFLLNPANRGDLLPWLMVIVAETILIFHALMSMWVMLAGYGKNPPYAFYEAQGNLYDPEQNDALGVGDDPTQWPLHINGHEVTVDVHITVYGEPLDVIRTTVLAAQGIRGKHDTYILDDGNSDAVRDLASRLRCGYIRRLSNAGAKAGNVNNALSIAKGDFYVIFDADFIAEPEFLEETLPHMADTNVAFVQTPQTYGNMHNAISKGAGYMQNMFYRFIQPGRNEFNAAFCVGTNVLFRRTAIEDIGGMYTQSKSEDVWTSLMLHERGWRSVFVAQKLATGDAPETIEAYSKQQLRWATGGFEILFTHNPMSRKRNLTIDQKLMYFVTATHYLTGIAPGILLFVPALEVFFDLHPVNLTVGPWTWLLFYSGFYVLQIVLAAVILGTFRPQVLLLAAASFPIYLRALRNAFLGVDTKWSVTGTTGGKASAFTFIIPQVLTFVFLVMTSAVSIWRDLTVQHFNIATFWSVVNSLILGAFIITAFSENHAARVEAKRAARAPLEPMPENLENHLAAAVEHRRDTPFGREQIVGARHAIDDLASGNAPVAGSRYSTPDRNEDHS
ncbi:glycosyltransferase family 2 protein [Nigerium sp.]|jgi:cellulose synthase (UDP-forming)|uniref:glycosyltransferase family 2 protein n=1 Tax=Nigerium sp. TaxID=2042655 RepID=UPI003221D7AC